MDTFWGRKYQFIKTGKFPLKEAIIQAITPSKIFLEWFSSSCGIFFVYSKYNILKILILTMLYHIWHSCFNSRHWPQSFCHQAKSILLHHVGNVRKGKWGKLDKLLCKIIVFVNLNVVIQYIIHIWLYTLYYIMQRHFYIMFCFIQTFTILCFGCKTYC